MATKVKAEKTAKKPKAPKVKATPAKKASAAGGEGKSVIDRSRYQYEKSDVKTASGKRKCVDTGDAVAEALRGLATDDVLALAKKNGATPEQLERWAEKNAGMTRMNAGNFLRGRARKEGSLVGV